MAAAGASSLCQHSPQCRCSPCSSSSSLACSSTICPLKGGQYLVGVQGPGQGQKGWQQWQGCFCAPPSFSPRRERTEVARSPFMPFLVVIVTPNPVVSPFKRPGSLHLGRDMAQGIGWVARQSGPPHQKGSGRPQGCYGDGDTTTADLPGPHKTGSCWNRVLHGPLHCGGAGRGGDRHRPG